MNVLVKMVNEDEVADLRDQFQAIDKDGTGMIHASELTEVLKNKGTNLADDEVEQIIQEVDVYGNGKINYSEFLVATMDVRRILSGES